MQAGLEMRIKQENWVEAAKDANNLSELQLTRGEISLALAAAEQSVHWADNNGDEFQRMGKRGTLADVQHQTAELAIAAENFAAAEVLQKQRQAAYPQLYSLAGFRYCDLLLTRGEWREVLQRAEQTLQWAQGQGTLLLTIALDQLSLGRAHLQQAISLGLPVNEHKLSWQAWQNAAAAHDCPLENLLLPESPEGSARDAALAALQQAENWLNQAVAGFRAAGQEDDLPRGLLARASYQRVALSLNPETPVGYASRTFSPGTSGTLEMVGDAYPTGLTLALQDLQECLSLAERSGMRLFLADYHLEAARLAITIKQPVLNQTAAEHKAAAEVLIKATGYKRRLPELASL